MILNAGLRKAAFAAVVGRPSAGKSTLINMLCGRPVSIVSPVPQTTRNAIRGIVNREAGQLILVDTPGMHLSEKKFNRRLTETAVRAAAEADLILYVLDASRPPGPEEEAIAAELAGPGEGDAGGAPRDVPLFAAINKMDLPGADPERAAAFLSGRFPLLAEERRFRISAKTGDGTGALLAALYAAAPEGPPLYPEEYYTDQEMDFRIAEVIRGEALSRLRQELPHAVYVEIADMEWRRCAPDRQGAPDRREDATDGVTEKMTKTQSVLDRHGCRRRLWVRAFIICERESQKGMIVGRGGSVIKAIGEASRKKLNALFDWKVELDLRVKAGGDWRHRDNILRKVLK
ncbi:MAG: GTPase Era [Treponema sp.]|nr:GTPase Era [Treponema sp.]